MFSNIFTNLKSLTKCGHKFIRFNPKRYHGTNNHINVKNSNLINQYKNKYSTTHTHKPKLDIKIDMDIPPRSTVVFFAKDTPGCLSKCLGIVAEYEINLTRIESRFVQDKHSIKFRMDTTSPYRDKKLQLMMKALEPLCDSVNLEEPRKVPWFPITMEQMDELALKVLPAEGAFEKTDAPAFTDKEYIKRRDKITQAATEYKYPEKPKIVNYSKEEVECWGTIWSTLLPLLEKHACDEYWEVGRELHKQCGYRPDNIPQLAEINDFIQSRTGFRLRPTAGLLSSRHFLNGLAFKTFFCTQYIRHPDTPFYTPEPDVVHELVGHAPLFADPEFAKFSQEIGLASIGATDGQIDELARCYWYSVEFGICKSKDKRENKIYGAGILSSVDEIKNAMLYAPMPETGKYPEIRSWNPFDAAGHPFPITKLQDVYYLAESFQDAKKQMSRFSEFLDKSFSVTWDDEHQQLIVDGNVYRDDPTDDLGTYGG